jgi:FkbM family methyltransferase
MQMITRRKRNLFLQRLFWTAPGFLALRGYCALRKRIDYVLLNHSLDSETNGEYWLLDQLPAEPVVVDVGFNSGDFTAEVLRRRPKAKVFAFDPARKISGVYHERFGADSRVRFFNIALSDTAGEFEFHDYDNMCSSLSRRLDAGPEAASYFVKVERLDDWLRANGVERVDFLKIDAEGYDWNVLAGAISAMKSGIIAATMFEFASGWIGNRKFMSDVFRLLGGSELELCHVFNGFLAPKEYSVALEAFCQGRMYLIRKSDHDWAGKLPSRNLDLP